MRATLPIILLLTSAPVWAQGGRGGQRGYGAGGGLDLTKVTTIEGTVTAVRIAYGAQYPSIEVSGQSIKVAPPWFLLENDFEIRTGDRVWVKAAPSLALSTDLHAIEIKNLTNNDSITLRDANGFPLWVTGSGGGRRAPVRSGCSGSCLAAGSTRTVTGTINQLTFGPGIGQPSLVLETPDKGTLNIRIGSERILLRNNFELKTGETITVTFGLAAAGQHYVALEITNSAGATLVLRHPDGTPAW